MRVELSAEADMIQRLKEKRKTLMILRNEIKDNFCKDARSLDVRIKKTNAELYGLTGNSIYKA